jgi:hypothetical protein
VGDEFVVGYGLDWAQRLRNLPYVGSVNLSQTSRATPESGKEES